MALQITKEGLIWTLDRKNTLFKKTYKMNRKDKDMTVNKLVRDTPLPLNEQRINKIDKVIPKLKDSELNHAGTIIKVRVT